MPRTEPRQVPLSEPEQTHRGTQTPAMLRVGWVFESLLKMNKRARCLDQSLEEVRVARIGLQPKLLEDIVRFVITLFVPTTEKPACLRPVNSGNRLGHATIKDDWPHPSHVAGRHRNFDFVLRALFRSGNGALPTQAASIAPLGSASCWAH